MCFLTCNPSHLAIDSCRRARRVICCERNHRLQARGQQLTLESGNPFFSSLDLKMWPLSLETKRTQIESKSSSSSQYSSSWSYSAMIRLVSHGSACFISTSRSMSSLLVSLVKKYDRLLGSYSTRSIFARTRQVDHRGIVLDADHSWVHPEVSLCAI